MLRLRRLTLSLGLFAALILAGGMSGVTPSQSTRPDAKVPSDAEVLADFQQRVQQYVELHRRLEGTVPPMRASEDPAEIRAAQDALRSAIRSARRGAHRGDIFTPAVERLVRRTIGGCLAGHDVNEVLAAINEENPPGVSLKPHLNARYPERASIAPTPPYMLCSLPQLPEELQFRFMNRDLILWDVHANLIVDFIRKVL
jgi:hypothetical protein